ncbi:hypothetical protein PLESTB_000222500 [Pleodorina starrii]|uniref:Uncharacterized protein n=1 Tax=Pleodorina starrii TaxID=330485 RepID=A0A9W6EYP9_9CHLO|nr:hypothetical protein PLESTM_001548400 [Pleodorina starrii]GLC49470.1 hypothetical protein PLESTB_000222500 [Pleodorina starrii]GLC75707.1 hypothetical protein PLESTF_001675900 [Pleodorina starrii]
MATTTDPISPKGPATYRDNKERGYNSKAKSLIYGGEERPDTPQNVGKRSVPHKGDNGAAPFATYVPGEEQPDKKEYHTKPKLKEGAAKPTGAAFDADVYRQQIALNYTTMQASKARNYGGNGVFN